MPITVPCILRTQTLGMQLVSTETDLSTNPELPVLLNSTVICPLSPGAIGFCGQSLAVVHPHEGLTCVMSKGELPVF